MLNAASQPSAPRAQVATPAGYVPDRPKIAPWMIALGAAGALALILVGLNAAGLLRFGAREEPKEMLRAQGQDMNPDLLRAQGQDTGPGVVRSATEEPIRMPDDVRRWLEHLERIEREKNALHRRQAVKLQASMSNIAARVSSAGVSAMINEEGDSIPKLDLSDLIPVDSMLQEWEALRQKLNSLPPPAECMPLYNNYHGSFVNIQREIGRLKQIGSDLYGIFQRGGQDQAVKDAEGVSAAHGQNVDELLIKSDEQLGEICFKYNERKWFDIKHDLGGSMMQFGL